MANNFRRDKGTWKHGVKRAGKGLMGRERGNGAKRRQIEGLMRRRMAQKGRSGRAEMDTGREKEGDSATGADCRLSNLQEAIECQLTGGDLLAGRGLSAQQSN